MKSQISTLKSQARNNLPGYYSTCMSAMVLLFLVVTLVITPFAKSQQTNPTIIGTVLYNVALIVISMIAVVFEAGIFKMHLAISNKGSCSIKDLLWAIRHQPDRFLIAGLILTLIYNIFLLPGRLMIYFIQQESNKHFPLSLLALAVVFLIIGAIITIVLGLMFSQTIYLLIEHEDWSAMAAFRESYHMTKGNKGALFYLYLSFIGWILLGILTFGVALLWIIPYLHQSLIMFYQTLKQNMYASERAQ